MATSDQVDTLHRNIWALTGGGAIGAMLGMSFFLMSYEYKDFDRVTVKGQDQMETLFHRRRKTSMAIMIAAIIVYIAGMTLICLGVSLYRDERENLASSVTGLITQIRNKAAQPSINEPAILAALSTVCVVMGIGKGAWDFTTTEQWGWIGSSIYTIGWLGLAFAGAMNDMSIDSLSTTRLAWTLTGSSMISAGTFIIPWQLHQNYISGPGWPIMALGYVGFTVGTGLVLPGPT
jgi:hypothetical protein